MIAQWFGRRQASLDVIGGHVVATAIGLGPQALLPSIRVPTRAIAGELAPSTSPTLMRGFTAIPGATFDVIEGAPHMISLEKPTELAAAILAGLD